MHHPFLRGVHDGRLPQAAFDRWLVQDYHFVEALVRAQARVLACAPIRDFAVLVGGLSAGVDELKWFSQQAEGRGLPLPVSLHPTCRAYADFLQALTYNSYAVQITALWAVERAYLDAWSTVRGGALTYHDFIEHWTTQEFHTYVHALEDAAGRALASTGALESTMATEAFQWVARYEAAFWQIAYEG